MNRAELLIVGNGSAMRIARAIADASVPCWRVREYEVRTELIATSEFEFFDAVDPGALDVFAAIGTEALNFARFDLCERLAALSFGQVVLMHPSAAVDPSTTLGYNCLVSAGATIGPGVRVGHGTVIGAGVHLGGDSQVGDYVSIGTGATIGAGSTIGPNVVIGSGVHLAAGISVGGCCEVSIPGMYDRNLADGTFIAPGYSGPVRLYRAAR